LLFAFCFSIIPQDAFADPHSDCALSKKTESILRDYQVQLRSLTNLNERQIADKLHESGLGKLCRVSTNQNHKKCIDECLSKSDNGGLSSLLSCEAKCK
jgi:hypothetical protein